MKHFRIYYTMSMDIMADNEDDVRERFDNMTSRQLGEDAYDVEVKNIVEVHDK